MSNCNLNKEDPWNNILHVLCLHLELKIRNFKQYCNSSCLCESMVKTAQENVKRSYENYSYLRKFLGKASRTKIEAEALEIIEYTYPWNNL